MKDNKHILQVVKGMCDRINESNSSLAKQEALRKVLVESSDEDNSIIHSVLTNVYDSRIKFGVTSTNVKKYMETHDLARPARFIGKVFYDMQSGILTGHAACQDITDIIKDIPEELVDTLYNILDKNLKIRMDAKSINKVWTKMYGSVLIPIFSVSLCNVYAERRHKVNFIDDLWLASRKLDGCRLIAQILPDDTIKFFSRQGKEFTTLTSLADSIRCYFPADGLALARHGGLVLDGEICIVDDEGNEDFKAIMKEITRKNHTIDRPMFKVYDLMSLADFNNQSTKMTFTDRNAILKDLVTRYRENITVENKVRFAEDPESITEPFMMEWVEQVPVRDETHFEELFQKAKDLGWEGIVIRKDDTVICRRSDSMLKVKAFQDAEYVVEGVEMGPFRVIKDGKEVEEDVMTNAFITHKGNRVSVGSGWSLEQRRRYKEHPEELIGKTITVQYFEETTDKDGNISLRFPTCKYVYEDGREV